MARNTSVLGIYPDRATLSDAINALHKAGYRTADISVLSSDTQGSKDFGHEKRNKAAQGAAAGTAVGALLGAALGWLVAIQTVTFAGSGAVVAAGPAMAALAGAGAGGALGWLIGTLAGLNQTEYVARRYSGRMRRGGLLLSVHCDSPEWCGRAKRTLKDTGALNISSASESAADYGATDKPMERTPATFLDRSEAATPLAAETVHNGGK